MAQTRILELSDFPEWAASMRRPHQEAYFAMYSSVYDGIVTDPVLMMVPVDDHLVHRGDGVFETLKCVDGRIYNLHAHLERLAASAGRIELDYPWMAEDLSSLIVETVRAGAEPDCSIRVLISRGPGSLGINPYDCSGPELYVVVSRRAATPVRSACVRAAASVVPVKAGMFANIKSCNYLPNAMMKKEAVDRGLDYVLSFDEQGHLAEGPAESAAIVDADGVLAMPHPGRILPGTTIERTAMLAEALVGEGLLADVACVDIGSNAVADAREVLIFGTTPDVVSVVEWEGRPVGDGRPGPVATRLAQLLRADMREPGQSTPAL